MTTGNRASRRILVADDSSTIQKVIKIAFSRLSTEIIEASSLIEALSALGRAAPALPEMLIVDASLPGARSPVDFRRLANESGGAPVLLLVGSYEAVNEDDFRAAGFQYFLKKPFESGDIVAMAEQLLEQRLTAAPASSPGSSASSSTQSSTQSAPVAPPAAPADFKAPPAPPAAPSAAPTTTIAGDMGAGPVTPPPPGRAFRETIIGGQVPGASPALNADLNDLNALHHLSERLNDSWNLPPPPLTDESRKGRKAYEGSPHPDDSITNDVSDSEMSVSSRPVASATPNPYPNPGLTTTMSSKAAKAGPKMPAGDVSLSEQLLPLLEQMLPALVRQAVEDYCNRHFKPLAREVIATELRRLADEKARHLVDN